MKKNKTLILGVLTFIIFLGTVYAAENSLTLSVENISGENIDEETFSVDITINTTIEASVFRFPFSFDSSKLKLKEATARDGYRITVDSNVLIEGNPRKGTYEVATLTFELTENFKVMDATTIIFGNGEFAGLKDEVAVKGTLLTIQRIPEPETPKIVKGDWNGNGTIDIQDLARARLFWAGDETFEEPELEIVDMNENGKHDLTDLERIRIYLAEEHNIYKN